MESHRKYNSYTRTRAKALHSTEQFIEKFEQFLTIIITPLLFIKVLFALIKIM